MPGTLTKSIKTLEWEHRFAAIFKCSSKTSDPTEIVVADKQAMARDVDLQRVLKALEHDLIFKQIYPSAKNPTTRILPFRSGGQKNEAQQLLDALRAASDEKEVEVQAVKLAHRYMLTRNIQNGLLIFLVAEARVDNKSEGTCAFVFKCDFEDISQLSAEKHFRKINDAIVEKTKKGTLYPNYADGKFDDTVRVFDEFGETQYWLDFLDLGEPPVRFPQLHAVTMQQWEQLKPNVPAKYQAQIDELAAGRSLIKKDLFTSPEDRLTPAETEKLIAAVAAKTGKQNISLKLDQAKAIVSLEEYGKTWIVAEQAGTRFILIKGNELRMSTDMLNPVDLAARPTLKQAFARLDIPV